VGIHILGQNHDVAVFHTTTGRTVRYWAERGIIHFDDDTPPLGGSQYGQLSIMQAEQYLANIAYMIGKPTDQGVEVDQRERKSLVDWINKMGVVIRKAKEQGDPQDQFKKAIAEAAAKLPKKLTVSVPQKYFE
jgi:hypothetical protein